MELRPEELAGALQHELLPIYLISGDETLLVEEAADQVIAAANAQGYTERQVMFAEGSFDWGQLHDAGLSMSLFAERKVIDVRVNGKVDRSGSEALRQYASAPPEDTLLLLRTPKLDRGQRNSAWVKALQQHGGVVIIWGIDQRSWPRWLKARLGSAGLAMQPDAFDMFSKLVEGNLLAAVQEIQKLHLADLPQPIGREDLEAAMEDASHHDNFELIDAVFAGDVARIARVTASLRSSGISPFAVLGPFVGQLRQLSGGGWMPRDRARAAEGFKRRVGSVDAVLAECALIDQQCKGQWHGDGWVSLERLFLRTAGERQFSLLGRNLDAVKIYR